MDVSRIELDHCSELALVPGSLFEFTSRYLSPERRESLLALYALKQSVSTIPQTPVDDTVKWAKLKWWSEEFAADPVSPSRHPVLRVLWSSGARNHLDVALLQRMIRDAVMQIDVAPVSDETAMFKQFAAFGSTDIQLELALENAEIDSRDLDLLGAATGLCRVISSFGPNQRSGLEYLPLSLLAKYNISLAENDETHHAEGLTRLIAELAENSLVWFSEGLVGLQASLKTGTCTHLQLRLAMEKRRLNNITKNANSVFESNQLYGPVDAWFAWWFLRRLK